MIATLDRLRAQTLATTLRVKALRQIYGSRTTRVFFSYCFGLVAASGLAVWWPTFLLYLPPFLFGLPHLAASFMFSIPQRDRRPGLLVFYGLCSVGLAAFVWWAGTYSVAVVLGLSSIGVYTFIHRRNPAAFFYPLIFVILGGVLLFEEQAVLALLVGHNLIAFSFWYRSSKTQAQKQFVLLAIALMFIACAAVIGIASNGTQAKRLLSEVSLLLLGQDSASAISITAIFLVSQSSHYFVWLKAIPDFQSPSETPGGFGLALRRLSEQMGTATPLLIGAGVSGLLTFSWAIGLETTRNLYIALAAFHGFYEIGAWLARPSKLTF